MLNLTQNASTLKMMEEGIEDLSDIDKEKVKELLHIEDLPSFEELEDRADMILSVIRSYMPGGSCLIDPPSYFVQPLTQIFLLHGYDVVFPFQNKEGEYIGSISSY